MLKSINVFERSAKYEGEFYAELVYNRGKRSSVVISPMDSLRKLAERTGADLEIYVTRDDDVFEPYQQKPRRARRC